MPHWAARELQESPEWTWMVLHGSARFDMCIDAGRPRIAGLELRVVLNGGELPLATRDGERYATVC